MDTKGGKSLETKKDGTYRKLKRPLVQRLMAKEKVEATNLLLRPLKATGANTFISKHLLDQILLIYWFKKLILDCTIIPGF